MPDRTESLDEFPEAKFTLTGVAHNHVFVWAAITQTQANRILSDRANPNVRQMDALLFAFALRNVLRAGELIAKVEEDAAVRNSINTAVDRFRFASPDVVAARDVLEHFDDYLRGIGDYQQPGTRRGARVASQAPVLDYQLHYDAEGHVLYVGNYSVDIAKARDAAWQLYLDHLEIRRAQAFNGGDPG